jgi:AhpD family alkylhydroperoxidase
MTPRSNSVERASRLIRRLENDLDLAEVPVSNPAMILPEAMQALQALHKSLENGGVPAKTIGLVHLRASQINGCAVCVDMHPRMMERAGETKERLCTVAAWRDAPYFQRRRARRRSTSSPRISESPRRPTSRH